tara:strand:- start:4199 stop:4543 length:345 start_codon:yes stop_codon:yes gene_type:complete
MPALTLTFPQALNTSVQIGDMAYYCPVTANECTQASIVQMGLITAINQVTNTITVDIAATVANPGTSDFILFSKDAVANVSSLTGYFAEVQFRNNSTSYGELFGVGADVHESSK